jgi:hypothetical protein
MIRVRYEPNNKSFGAMMMADQTQDLADQGARRGVLEARRLASSMSLPERYIASIKATEGPPMRLGRNVRRTARVEASYVFIEFGSGQKRPRPQGGSSPAYRVLGRTASVVGSLPRRVG